MTPNSTRSVAPFFDPSKENELEEVETITLLAALTKLEVTPSRNLVRGVKGNLKLGCEAAPVGDPYAGFAKGFKDR